METEEWFTLEAIEKSTSSNRLYCLAVDSPEKQFLVGNMDIPTHNTEEGKAEDALKGEAAMIIGSIARLGRAAGVHMVIATQRPDATLISGETKANLGVRVNCGRTNATASSMILENGEGSRVKANPRGRLYLQIYGQGDHGQGFFADSDWIDKYLASQGLNPDGTPLTGKRSKLAHLADMNDLSNGATLDALEGVDNTAIIEAMRKAEESLEDGDEDWSLEEVPAAGGINLQKDPALEDDLTEEEVTFEDDGEEEPPAPPTDRPQLTHGKSNKKNPWDRPEDDWDEELEELIARNNAQD